MPELHVQAAFQYYKQHINRKERFNLLRKFNFPIAGSVPAVGWELFGSILTGDLRKVGYGSDLRSYEIRSAKLEGSFEYQYHLHGGLTKLRDDTAVGHIFISYSADYADIVVRSIPGAGLAPYFQQWEPKLKENYSGINPRQRFRRSIAYGKVIELGTIIMEIKDSHLISSDIS